MKLAPLVLVPVLIACASPDPVLQTGVARMHQEISFGEDTAGNGDALLASPVFGVGDGQGGFVALEPFGGRLLKFSSAGELEWVHRAPGRGPGEIDNPDPPVLTPDGRIAFSNQSGSRIDFFSMGGELDASVVDMPSPGPLVGFLPNGNPVISPFEFSGTVGAQVHVLSGDELAERFNAELDDRIEGSDLLPVRAGVRVVDSEIVLVHPGRYAYSAFTPDGELRRQVARDVDYSPPLTRSIAGGIRSQRFSTLYGPFPLSENRWLGGGQWPAGTPDLAEYVRQREAGEAPAPLEYLHSLDIFDREGQLVALVPSTALDSLGVVRVLDADGADRVYALVRDGTVGRFKLVMDG